MPYDFDSAKAAANLAKHGVPFSAADDFDWNTASVEADMRAGDPEVRLVATGLIGDRVHILVFVIRRGIRLISLRPANLKEATRYVSTLD